MSQAIVGLIGVVIGGLLTGGVEFALERRRERRSGTAAARLVMESLDDIDSFIKASLARRAWLGDPSEILSNAAWSEHRVVLAEAPGFDGWYPVAGAWGWIVKLRRLVDLFGEEVGDDPLAERDQAFFEIGLLLTGIASKALTAYASTESYRDPPEDEPTALQQELAGIFEHAAKEGDGSSSGKDD